MNIKTRGPGVVDTTEMDASSGRVSSECVGAEANNDGAQKDDQYMSTCG